MKLAIVTDSTAYIPLEQRELYNIHIVPLSVHLEDGTYEEEVEITATEFYDKVRHAKTFPKTTQPPVGKFVELYEQLGQQYDAVISMHISSGISGTYSGAVQASDMVENVNITVYDSEITCYVLGTYVIEAARRAEQGASVEEIIAHLDELKASMDAYFVVDDLGHLQRGGRLSATAAFIGSLLQVKPILRFSDKVIVPFEKIRTHKKALRRVEELFAAALGRNPSLRAIVIHGNCEQAGQEWMAKLQQMHPHVDFTLSYFGPVIGTHLGEGALALIWLKK